MKRRNLCWTRSINEERFLKYGYQIKEQYSKCGRTSDTYKSLIDPILLRGYTTVEFKKKRKFFFLFKRCFRVLKIIYQKMEGGKNV